MNALLQAPGFTVLGWALVSFIWEGALVALAAALALRLLRHSTPSIRYLVAVLALVVMAFLPIRKVMNFKNAPTPIQIQVQPERGRSFQAGPAGMVEVPAQSLRTRMVLGVERMLPQLVLVWMVGMLVFALRLAGGWAWIQHLRWRSTELAPDELQGRLLALCRRAGLKRAVSLLTSQGLHGPLVVGFLRPAILVPAGWFLQLPPEQVEALLAHELAHVLRHDYVVNLLQSFLEVVFFYHPGVWWLSRRIRAERELAADAFAARLLGDGLPLAQALTHLERRGLGRARITPAPAAHGGSLMERIQHLLFPSYHMPSAPRIGAVAALALILASGFHLLARTPQQTNPVGAIAQKQDGTWPPDGGIKDLYVARTSVYDAQGKPVPYTWTVDLFANDVPLNQAWRSFLEAMKADPTYRNSRNWSPRKLEIAGPRISVDLRKVPPTEVVALFEKLAKENGVAPYVEPERVGPSDFYVTKRTRPDGKAHYDFHASQVSLPFLEKLMAEARSLDADPGARGATVGEERKEDNHPGPKVDALFEDLSLPELEKRVQALKASVR